jgi:predicted RNA binding protein YcfA (HicA-like mRNA interferase family)
VLKKTILSHCQKNATPVSSPRPPEGNFPEIKRDITRYNPVVSADNIHSHVFSFAYNSCCFTCSRVAIYYREFLKKLKKAGVEIATARGKGSHVRVFYQGRNTTVPFHDTS